MFRILCHKFQVSKKPTMTFCRKHRNPRTTTSTSTIVSNYQHPTTSIMFIFLISIITFCLSTNLIATRTLEVESPEDDGMIAYKDCGNGNLRRLKVLGCEPNEERISNFCRLTRGSNASLVAKFISDGDYPSATTDVRIKIGFLEFGYPPIEHDACLHYVECPLEKDELTAARVTFPIPSLVPKFGNMLITARLYGPNGELIVCGSAKAGLI